MRILPPKRPKNFYMTSHKQLRKYILEHVVVGKSKPTLAIDYFKEMVNEGEHTFEALLDNFVMMWPIEYQDLVRNIYKEECKAALHA